MFEIWMIHVYLIDANFWILLSGIFQNSALRLRGVRGAFLGMYRMGVENITFFLQIYLTPATNSLVLTQSKLVTNITLLGLKSTGSSNVKSSMKPICIVVFLKMSASMCSGQQLLMNTFVGSAWWSTMVFRRTMAFSSNPFTKEIAIETIAEKAVVAFVDILNIFDCVTLVQLNLTNYGILLLCNREEWKDVFIRWCRLIDE